MTTQATTEDTSAPSSPSSRADNTPTDSVASASRDVVVDVTGGDEPWTATSARTTTDPPPLRTSKRAAHCGTTAAALTEARKGKKKATKRTPAASTGRKKPGDGEDSTPSDQALEGKVAPPKSKRSKKAPASTEVPATSVQLPASSFPETTSSRQGFDLTSFMASFDPGHATVTDTADTPESRLEGKTGEVAATTPRGPVTEVMTELRALREEVVRLRLLHGHNGVGRGGATPAIVTAPNSKGELPPPDVRFLTSSSFQEGSKKTKGDYNPPQAHLLAASRMFRDFGMNSNKITSAMSFVLRVRELECVKFRATPAVLMAIFSGRLGSRGLTIMHFKESSEMACLEDGSTNANFSSDFGPSAGLPTVGVECGSYEDILDAIHGLNALGQDVWYDYMRKLTSRLRVFVSKNKSADPDTTPVRVRLTLMYVNKFLGSALAYMQDDNTQWWILPREREISPEGLRFANEILSLPADVPGSSPSRFTLTCGESRQVTSSAIQPPLTIQSGSTIQSPKAIQPPLTIQSGSTIQSPTAIQPFLTLQSGSTIQSPPSIQPPLSIQSGSAIQSPTGIRPALTIQSMSSIQPSTYTRPPGCSPSRSDDLYTSENIRRNDRRDNTKSTKVQIPMNPDISTSMPSTSGTSQANPDKLHSANRDGTGNILRIERTPRRRVVSSQTADQMHENARRRRDLNREVQSATLGKAMASFGIKLPAPDFPTTQEGADGPVYVLNKPLQRSLSELARRSALLLPAFVELVRGQTERDYRPNKNLVPAVLGELCREYKHLAQMQIIAQEGVKVQLKETPPRQSVRPVNHGSARGRINILRKNIRKEQDAGRCLVLDMDLLKQWPEIIISPFGVVDKGSEDSTVSGRTIHDLSYPEGTSINDCTDQDSITKPDYIHCDAVAREILKAKQEFPDVPIYVMAGDVATAFRNISIHSNSVYLFAGLIEEENALVIELSAPFGWTGSPGFYEIFGGAISHFHGCHTQRSFSGRFL